MEKTEQAAKRNEGVCLIGLGEIGGLPTTTRTIVHFIEVQGMNGTGHEAAVSAHCEGEDENLLLETASSGQVVIYEARLVQIVWKDCAQMATREYTLGMRIRLTLDSVKLYIVRSRDFIGGSSCFLPWSADAAMTCLVYYGHLSPVTITLHLRLDLLQQALQPILPRTLLRPPNT